MIIITAIPIHTHANENLNLKVDSLILQTDQLWEEDKIDEAIKCINYTIPLIIKVHGKQSDYYANYLNDAARIYQDKGDYNRALKIIEECLLIKAQLHGSDSPQFAISLATKSSIFSELGRSSESLNLFEDALKIYDNNNLYYTIENAEILKDYGIAYYELSDYDKAYKYVTEAYNIIQYLDLTFEDYRAANIAVSYATILTEFDEMENAIESLSAVVEYLEQCNCNKLVYIYALSNLASFYKYTKNYTKCIEISSKALHLIDTTVGQGSSWLNFMIGDIADSFFNLGEYNKAESFYYQGLRNSEQTLGFNHETTIRFQEKLFELKLAQEDYTHLYQDLLSIYTRKTTKILNDLSILNSDLQEKYWNESHMNWYSQNLPSLCHNIGSEDLYSIAYNGLLFSKSLLLDSESRFLHALKKHPDQSYYHRYEAIKNIRKTCANDQIDSLDIEERQLRTEFLNHSDYMEVFNITWEKVKSALHPNEIAIEFFSYVNEQNYVQYGALTIKPEYNHPHLIPLCTSADLNDIPNFKYYTTTLVSDLIWGRLQNELCNTNSIFFSPIGELNNIAIENLPLDTDTYVCDKYNLYRLSSTRNLVSQDTPLFIVSAALFGGLNYNVNLHNENIDFDNNQIKNGVIPDLSLFRDGYDYLPGTQIEIDKAEEALKNLNLAIKKYTDIEGTKTAFQDLSGQAPSYIHIATHGFFPSRRDTNDCGEFLEGYNGIIDTMNESGLLFSGANYFLKNPTKSLKDNGILTATEVSELDLFDLDLVVLSACQTGLGEIKGDGVYGLQRGFKMAGCSSLMMSLWRVDDEATQILMINFYDNLTSGLNKQQSLQKAKSKVREFDGEINGHYRNFSHPKYWAAFILLDALN